MTNTHPRRVPPYSMAQQLRKGETAEAHLDQHFADRFRIVPASREQQRLGIDRIFIKHTTGHSYTVEYKTDWTAGRTGNAFVETVSVDSGQIPGWAYSSHAEWLLYFVPATRTIYLITFADLRAQLSQWISTCKAAPPIPNAGYHTLGILVPLTKFARVASRIEVCSAISGPAQE